MLEVWVVTRSRRHNDLVRTALSVVPGVRPRLVDASALEGGPPEQPMALVVDLELDADGLDARLEAWRGHKLPILGLAEDPRPRRLARARERYELAGLTSPEEAAPKLFERLASFVRSARESLHQLRAG